MKVQIPLIHQLTFKSKLILLTLFASISSVIVIAILSIGLSRRGLRQAAFSQLNVLRSEQAEQVQNYFQQLQSHTLTLSANRAIVVAMVEFNKEFRRLDRQFIPTEWDEPLKRYYEANYFPRLSDITGSEPRFGSYRPSGQAARYLQHYYLSQNDYLDAEKNQLITADDDSEYSRYHSEFHPLLNDIAQQFGYADLYLINQKTGDIVYSVNKRPDYGTNLETGAYRDSSLADLVATVRESSARGEVAIADFAPYEPASGVPSLFIASPIYNGPYVVGILAIRLETDQISQLMTETLTEDTPSTSLDSYLVGADGSLRSEPQFFRDSLSKDDIQSYTRRLRRQGVSDETLAAITRLESPVLLQPVKAAAAQSAIGGATDTERLQDYRGVSVLSAYAPLEIEGLDWAVISQIDTAEAFATLTHLELAILVASILLITAFTFLAMAAATMTIQPVRQLNEWADRVVDGDFEAEIDLDLEDEIGQLTDTLQIMVTSLSHQVATLDQKMAQNEVLLTNLVPPAIAKRLKRGETIIADQIRQITVIYANIVGISELSQTLSPEEVTALLTKLMQAFDDVGEQHGMERQNTPSVDYMAICGLTTARLDHTKRTVDFALEMLKIINLPEFGQSFALGLRLAVHTGPVTAGVVGTKRFGYSVWGESIYLVTRLYAHAALNSVVLTEAAYQQIAETYTCVAAGAVAIEKFGRVETWILATREKLAVRQVELVQRSFAKVEPISEQVGKLFYEHLFETRPDFKPLFSSTDMETQQRKLMMTLATAVEGLRHPEEIISKVQALGRSHQGYGVKAEDYEAIGATLLWTLKEKLGDDFTPEVKRAWEVAFQFLSKIMINAAAQIESDTQAGTELETEPTTELEIELKGIEV
ncbi:Globin domain protein [Synechococcus sp. PCC 7335]|uniref:adenylate/guanylate cyclase domain-containing protein n=1 Tax=Synechococcus sp. (strain ATCC 29403 / PCC 7335) TaxID=91464 RepID=UPI00017ECB67|nr:adenylate/guanylate cyclase domain-containing protein [Synechococcus sp. PCC 7335]EDX83240.1 Globin domain protein [Synechococcus sp. PCC 7335]